MRMTIPKYSHIHVALQQCRYIFIFPALTTAKVSFPHLQLLMGQQQFLFLTHSPQQPDLAEYLHAVLCALPTTGTFTAK